MGYSGYTLFSLFECLYPKAISKKAVAFCFARWHVHLTSGSIVTDIAILYAQTKATPVANDPLVEKVSDLAKKLYVGNLTYETTESDLREMFAEFGPIASVALIKDRETGTSKGFAFVEMETQEGAEQVRKKLNNTMMNNRALKIDEARPSGSRDRGAGGGGRTYGGGYGSKRGSKKRGKKRGGGGGSASDYGGW